MALHFTGPILQSEKSGGSRQWYSNLPVGEDPSYVSSFNDFLFSQNYAAADWVVTETQAGATQAIAADELNGALLLTNSAADDDVNQLQSTEEAFRLTAGKKMWFECKMKISDATQSDFYIGLATTDTTIIAGTTDSIGFRKLDGSATVSSITEDATVETTNTANTIVTDTYVTYGFYWDGSAKVEFSVDRALTATHTTNIEQTNKLALTFTLQNGEAVAKNLTIDYYYITMER